MRRPKNEANQDTHAHKFYRCKVGQFSSTVQFPRVGLFLELLIKAGLEHCTITLSEL